MLNLWLSLWSLLLGCREKSFPQCDAEGELPVLEETPTWNGAVRALTESKCGSCHTEGGIAPTPFETYEEAKPWSEVIAETVRNRSMPPWPPVDCCRPLQHSLALTDEEIATFVAWSEGGAPEGDEADYVAPDLPETGLPRIDATLAMREPYTPAPKPGTIDDTRCFLVDWPEALDEARYVTGMAVRPGTPDQVHHIMLLVVSPLSVPSLQLTDDASPGPGWSCPGGIVWGATNFVGGWSPGWTARETPEGTGQKVEKGSKLVLTVHYSVADGQPEPDLTEIDIMTEDSVQSEILALTVVDPAWLTGGLVIPAGDSDVMVSHRYYPLMNKTLVGVNMHMHERGSRGSVGVIREDGSEECLLQIDDWAHEWQGDYLFEEPLQLGRGDSLWVECHWDNTAGNQRVVNGAPEEPRTLRWAEDEEMCVAFVMAKD